MNMKMASQNHLPGLCTLGPLCGVLVLGFGSPTSALAQSTYTPYTFTRLAGNRALAHVDGAGSAARFYTYGPYGVAVDGAGNVYVGDTYNHSIRKVTRAGVVTT